MAKRPMHKSVQYTADRLLSRSGIAGGLDEFLKSAISDGWNAQETAAQLVLATDGDIVVDRRTVARWLDAVDEN